MAEVACPRCGYQNPPGSNFCASCGYPLGQRPDDTATIVLQPEGEAAEPEAGAAAAEAGAYAILVVTRGPNVGARIPLVEPVVTVGRDPQSVLFLDDITVSRRHAEISFDAGRVEICDVGSLNGTYVNRHRVERAWLSSGDELQIGKFRLVFFERADG